MLKTITLGILLMFAHLLFDFVFIFSRKCMKLLATLCFTCRVHIGTIICQGFAS